MKINNCDMCGIPIKEGKCECGQWFDSSAEMPSHMISMKKALDDFHKLEKFTITGDIPHLGVACVYFRGDYNDCKRVEDFILSMKKRPFYPREDK